MAIVFKLGKNKGRCRNHMVRSIRYKAKQINIDALLVNIEKAKVYLPMVGLRCK